MQYTTLVSDFTPKGLEHKLEQLNKGVTHHYQLGDHQTLDPEEVEFLPNNYFRVIGKVEPSVKRGCPLLLVLSHNLVFAIGMLS